MSDPQELGKKGEQWASEHLVGQGYKILEKNYQFQRAEIDLIASDPETQEIVFTEVKTRYDNTLSSAQLAVGKSKQRQIIKAAHQYITSNDIDHESRFDIIWISVTSKGKKIEHIKSAFYPGL